mmetsp:Transcript_54461/g.101840  ORF Transcript_54461/g.101840 Transcript_54461/m.101840 type:complete len:286 (-) Transcript_54461:327-1184(-)
MLCAADPTNVSLRGILTVVVANSPTLCLSPHLILFPHFGLTSPSALTIASAASEVGASRRDKNKVSAGVAPRLRVAQTLPSANTTAAHTGLLDKEEEEGAEELKLGEYWRHVSRAELQLVSRHFTWQAHACISVSGHGKSLRDVTRASFGSSSSKAAPTACIRAFTSARTLFRSGCCCNCCRGCCCLGFAAVLAAAGPLDALVCFATASTATALPSPPLLPLLLLSRVLQPSGRRCCCCCCCSFTCFSRCCSSRCCCCCCLIVNSLNGGGWCRGDGERSNGGSRG